MFTAIKETYIVFIAAAVLYVAAGFATLLEGSYLSHILFGGAMAITFFAIYFFAAVLKEERSR